MVFSTVRACPSCGSKNRIPAGHLADTGRCGKCKAALPPTSAPLDVDAGAFDAITREEQVPILVDFWAEWCGPCRMAAPHVAQVARDMAGKALVLKVDTQANPALGARFGVQAIPYFLVLKGGRPVHQQAGLAPPAQMRRWLESA